MLNQSRYLGIDVSKDTLVVAFERNRWQVPNSKSGHRKLIAQIQKQKGVVHVVCESTGPYHLPMCLALQEAGLPVTIANSARIHYFGRSEGIIAKNDPIDAALIERFANSKRPLPSPPISREQIALCELITHRRHLRDAVKAIKTHRQQIVEAPLRKEIDRSLATLNKRIKSLEETLRSTIEANPVWKQKLEILTQVKGVGFLTALVLIAKMPELGALNRGQCASLSGLAPYDDDSGNHTGKRFIRGGRSDVRTALYMAAVSAFKHNPVSKNIYQRLIRAKKPFKVAITAVMRKLLIYLNSLLKVPVELPA